MKELTITIDGEIGCGKTTLAILLERYLKDLGNKVETKEIGFSSDLKMAEHLSDIRKRFNSLLLEPRLIHIVIDNMLAKDEKEFELENKKEFKIGDAVCLKGLKRTDIKMTVENVVYDTIHCIWVSKDNNVNRRAFNKSILVLVE